MKFVIPSIEVSSEDGFKEDLFHRKRFGHYLNSLILNTEEPLVLSINGRWGEGKTTFVKMWQKQLKEAQVHSIYIDAFQHDYSDDAFTSVASSIVDYAKEHSEDKIEFVKDFRNKAVSVSSHIAKTGLKTVIRIASFSAIDSNNSELLEDLKSLLTKELDSATDKYFQEKIDNHKENILKIKAFRNYLTSLPSKLNTLPVKVEYEEKASTTPNLPNSFFEQRKTESSPRPLVVIIDELDRCKPSFSLEILEKIKHLFSVKNVTFILVINKEQLMESVKSVYGNIDAENYLHKFITIETNLPNNRTKGFDNDYDKYTKYLIEKHELAFFNTNYELIAIIKEYSEHFSLSLRQLEKAVTYLVLFSKSYLGKTIPLMEVLILMVTLKVSNQQKLQEFCNKSLDTGALFRSLNLEKPTHDQTHLQTLKDQIIYLYTEPHNHNAQFDHEFSSISLDKSTLVSHYAYTLNIFP